MSSSRTSEYVISMQHTINILIFPADGMDQWNALCLDLNIWSCDDTIEQAVDMIKDAILVSLEDCDPGAFEAADQEYWELAAKVRDGLSPGVVLQTILHRDNGGWHIR